MATKLITYWQLLMIAIMCLEHSRHKRSVYTDAIDAGAELRTSGDKLNSCQDKLVTWVDGGRSFAQTPKRTRLVHRHMISLVTLYLVLGLLGARMVHMTFVINILSMHLDYSSTDTASLGIPGYMIANFERIRHSSAFEL